jgi:hypothetical protein
VTLWLADRGTTGDGDGRNAAVRRPAYRDTTLTGSTAEDAASSHLPQGTRSDELLPAAVSTSTSSQAPKEFSPVLPPIRPFRAAVADLVTEVGRCTDADGRRAEHILSKRVDSDEIASVLEATPDGWDATVVRLLTEVRNYEPSPRSAAGSLAALVRISLLAQIDAVWWGRLPGYQQDTDVHNSAELIDLDLLGQEGRLRFTYRHQAGTLLTRAARSAERRTMPGHSPRTAGLSMAKARPQVVAWLNQIAEEFAEVAPDGTPPLWVTSVARSVEYQQHLKSLGYNALLPSAHCVGYAADIEMRWYRRFHAHRLLRGLLLERQRAGEVNVIDEGQAWHVCLCPEIVVGQGRVPRPRPGS